MTDSERDLAAIAAVLNEPTEQPEPAPRVKVRPTGRKTVPATLAATSDDLDGDDDPIDDGSDLEGIVTAPVISPPRAPAVVGLPDVEGVPGVISARAAEADIQAKRKALSEAKGALLTALSLPAGAGERELDKRQVALIVAGADETDIEKLRALYKREKLLTEAASVAAGATQDAIRKARNALTAQAVEAIFKPAARASALALLELIQCKSREQAARNQLRASGFDQPNGTFHSDLLDGWHNGVILGLVRDGWLTAAEVRAACPHMSGV